jgi:hypothetical protein
MAKDVLITPANGIIEFRTADVTKAQIQLDSANNLVISANDGDVSIITSGSGTDLYVGDGVNETDIVFEQNGAVRALTGKTLTLGQVDSSLSFAANVTSGANITGNVRGGNFLTAGLISAAGNVSGGNLNVTGNIVDTGALSIITGSNGNIALAPNGTGIVTASGNLSAAGNITGSYILGNGSQLTGLPATYANANVAAYLASGSDTSNIITTANVSGGNILATTIVSGASHIGSIVSVTSNVTGGNLLTAGLISAASHIGSVVSVSANITGGNLLTGGLISATSNITSAANISGGNLLATTTVSAASHIGSIVSTTGNITSAANISGGNVLAATIISGASHPFSSCAIASAAITADCF